MLSSKFYIIKADIFNENYKNNRFSTESNLYPFLSIREATEYILDNINLIYLNKMILIEMIKDKTILFWAICYDVIKVYDFSIEDLKKVLLIC